MTYYSSKLLQRQQSKNYSHDAKSLFASLALRCCGFSPGNTPPLGIFRWWLLWSSSALLIFYFWQSITQSLAKYMCVGWACYAYIHIVAEEMKKKISRFPHNRLGMLWIEKATCFISTRTQYTHTHIACIHSGQIGLINFLAELFVWCFIVGMHTFAVLPDGRFEMIAFAYQHGDARQCVWNGAAFQKR